MSYFFLRRTKELLGLLLIVHLAHTVDAQIAPGDQTTDLTFWLKADVGVKNSSGTAAANGEGIETWENSSSGSLASITDEDNYPPTYSTHGPNGNPVAIFSRGSGSGDDEHMEANVLGSALFDDTENTIIVVHKYTGTGETAIILGWRDGGANRVLARIDATDVAEFQFPQSTDNVLGTSGLTEDYSISTFVSRSGSLRKNLIFLNGTKENELNGVSNVLDITKTTELVLGGTQTGENGFEGEIAEVIVYKSSLTNASVRHIETYLAIKYGITLDVSSLGYTIGSTSLYPVTPEFDQHIIGIGKDDSQGLDQDSARSVNANGILSVSKATSKDDGDFLLIGTSGGDPSNETGDYMGGTNNGSARKWKVEETGEIGTVTLTVDKSAIPTGDSAIYVKNGDPNLGAGGTLTLLTDDGSSWTVSLNLSDGDYFTFVSVPEISIQGNGNTIVNNDITPSSSDSTFLGIVDESQGISHAKYTIFNNGSGPLIFDGSPAVQIGGADASEFSVLNQPTTILTGGSDSFIIRFQPTSAGLKQATVTISNNDPRNDPFAFNIEGTGSIHSEIALFGNGVEIFDDDDSPRSADSTFFGNLFVGDSAIANYSITNTGAPDLVLGNPVISGSGAFTILQDPSSPLSQSSTTILTIMYKPSDVATHDATVSFSTNDSDENPFTFDIQGVAAVAPGSNLSNLKLWLKAGEGVENNGGNTPNNGQNVQRWFNQASDGITSIRNLYSEPPAYVNSSINGHPALFFDRATGANDDRLGASGITGSQLFDSDDNCFFIVHQFQGGAGGTTGSLLNWETEETNQVYIRLSSQGEARFSFPAEGSGTTASSTTSLSDQYTISTFLTRSDTEKNLIFLNGGDDAEATGVTDDLTPSGSAAFVLGGLPDGTLGYKGNIAEVIIYSQRLAKAERRDIETYLSLKYGIPLDVSPAGANIGYTCEGVEIYSKTENFKAGIAGLGRDDAQELNQTLSITVGGAMGMANPTDLDNKEFLIWGHNGKNASNLTGDFNGATNNGSARIWKVVETGDLGSVDVGVIKSEMPAGISRLIVDNDSDLSSPEQILTLSPVGTDTLATTVDFDNMGPNYMGFMGFAAIQVKGTSSNEKIVNGETNFGLNDDREFGLLGLSEVKSTSFTITNKGTQDLVTSVTIEGINASDFSIHAQPFSPLPPQSFTFFSIQFDPQSIGIKLATVKITSNDPDNSTFTFDIQGEAIVAPGDLGKSLSLWLNAGEGVTQSGSKVSNWSDQSGRGNHTSAQLAANQPDLLNDAINGNRSLSFSGDSIGGNSGLDTHDLFILIKPESDITSGSSRQSPLGWGSQKHDGITLGDSRPGPANDVIAYEVDNAAYTAYLDDASYIKEDQAQILGSRINTDGDDQRLTVNGKILDNATSNTTHQSYNGGFVLGNNATNESAFAGEIAEVISYSTRLTNAQRRHVDTYLAIKYGVSLNINSRGYTIDGSTLYASDATYFHNIVGIGKDESQGLNQAESENQEDGAIIQIHAVNALQDHEFLIIGSNGENSGDMTGDYDLGTDNGSARIWKARKLGEIGLVRINAEASNLPVGVSSIIIDNDADLQSPEQRVALNGTTTLSANINFADGDSYFSFAEEIILPVTWINFDVSLRDKEAIIAWETADENNVSHFEVLRSKNGKYFTAIAQVQSSGKSGRNFYETIDHNPHTGTSYYQIRQIDWNGKESFSEVREISYSGNLLAYNIFPNPVSEYVHFATNSSTTGQFTVLNMSGKVVKVGSFISSEKLKLDLKSLAEGVYSLVIQTNDMTIKEQLVKK